MNEKTIPEFHQVEPRLSLVHFPPVEATIKMWKKMLRKQGMLSAIQSDKDS